MSKITGKQKRPQKENRHRARLVHDRRLHELHANELKNEICQMKIALRVTQKRIRRINILLKREAEGRPMLRLVSNRDVSE